MSWLVDLAESGRVPDPLLRAGIRQLLRRRLREERIREERSLAGASHDLVAELRKSPVALLPEAANRQHYEVPAAFFDAVLGPHRKYSCAWWPAGVHALGAAEEAMLALTCERAGLADGMEILELGCGWGSLSLWMAERMPASRILALSNSRSQRERIEAEAAARGLRNLEVVTADVNGFDTPRRFDRVVSVEMFEHVRNHEELMRRIAGWLRPGGRLFVHHFAHRHLLYPYEDRGDDDWMARHFFTGGLMPSEDLLLHHQRDLVLEERWRVSGEHYRRTAEAWLANLDARRDHVQALFARELGPRDAALWVQRWRLFFLGCAELFGFRGGHEWGVIHLRFARRD